MAASLLQAEPDLHQSGDPSALYGWRILSLCLYSVSHAGAACCVFLPATTSSRLSDGVLRWLCGGVRPGDVLHRQCDRFVRAVMDVVLTFDGRERCCSRPFCDKDGFSYRVAYHHASQAIRDYNNCKAAY